MNKKTVRDIDVTGKRVLVRVDFNVPQDKKTSEITDDTRIKAALPTIKYLIDHKAKVILCSHLGRPKGVTPELTLKPVAQRLAKLLGQPVQIAGDCVGPRAEGATLALKDGEVLLLENLRFHEEEEKNDPAFAKSLASLAEVYVNDAFGTAHRAHASTAGVAKYLPAVAGFLMEKELEYLGKALAEPKRPFAMIVGGAKVSDKITMLENILPKVDALVIGGGMANTFLKAQGYDVGKSKVENEQLDFARGLVAKAKEKGVHLLLPIDAVAAERFEAGIAQPDGSGGQGAQRLADAGYRAADGEALQRGDQEGSYCCLERAVGRLRVPRLCQRHTGDRVTPGETGCDDHHRGRRHCSRRGAAGPGWQDDPRFDRRWGLSGIPGRQDAAGRGGSLGQVSHGQNDSDQPVSHHVPGQDSAPGHGRSGRPAPPRDGEDRAGDGQDT